MEEKMGTLYIVATPIGNMGDITLRAIETLKKVDIILAEDTRVTSKLLNTLNPQPTTHNLQPTTHNPQPTTHNPQLISYHQHSSDQKKYDVLKYLSEGKNIALVTDAGTPGISDPGNELIDFLLNHKGDIKITPIPGVSAVTTALSVSGFPTNNFVFLGFMPKKKKNKLMKWLKDGKIAFAYYDSPHRVIKNLELIRDIFGDEVKVVVARELTKLHETVYRGNAAEVQSQLQKDTLKGEMVVVIDNNRWRVADQKLIP